MVDVCSLALEAHHLPSVASVVALVRTATAELVAVRVFVFAFVFDLAFQLALELSILGCLQLS